MNYAQLIQLYFERSAALQWYWTLYVIVIGGLLAISNLRLRRDLLTVCLVTVLYACFASKNLSAIHEATLQRSAVLQAVRNYKVVERDPSQTQDVRSLLEPTLVQPDYDGIRTFHVSCDVLTIFMLWAMERRRVRTSKQLAQQQQQPR